MNIRPLHDRVVVRRAEEEATSQGGIILTGDKEKPVKGQVLAIGPGKKADDGSVISMCVKVKDTVLFGKYAGTEVTIDGEELVVMREDDIMGVIEG